MASTIRVSFVSALCNVAVCCALGLLLDQGGSLINEISRGERSGALRCDNLGYCYHNGSAVFVESVSCQGTRDALRRRDASTAGGLHLSALAGRAGTGGSRFVGGRVSAAYVFPVALRSISSNDGRQFWDVRAFALAGTFAYLFVWCARALLAALLGDRALRALRARVAELERDVQNLARENGTLIRTQRDQLTRLQVASKEQLDREKETAADEKVKFERELRMVKALAKVHISKNSECFHDSADCHKNMKIDVKVVTWLEAEKLELRLCSRSADNLDSLAASIGRPVARLI